MLGARAKKLDCLVQIPALLLCNPWASYLTSFYLSFLLDNEVSMFIVKAKIIDLSKAFRTMPGIVNHDCCHH